MSIFTVLLVLLVFFIIGFVVFISTGISLPEGANEVVRSTLVSGQPELVTGETGKVPSGALEIWYEKMTPSGSEKGTILLVMGHSSTAMLWANSFCQSFVDAGYVVIRYDNRDVGLSTWIKDWDKKNPYNLEDMALDGMAILDYLNIPEVHVIGVSMGGMIAQRMAISHSNRVLSLTSIMSSGYMLDPVHGPIPKHFTRNFMKLGLRYLIIGSEADYMKFYIGIEQLLKGNGPYRLNIERSAQRTLYEIRKRRGFNRKAVNQQAKAIEASGSRYRELKNINVPTLIIHGKSDPLVIFNHALKYAPMIPHAKTLYFDGMGHDIPDIYMDQVIESILVNLGETI